MPQSDSLGGVVLRKASEVVQMDSRAADEEDEDINGCPPNTPETRKWEFYKETKRNCYYRTGKRRR